MIYLTDHILLEVLASDDPEDRIIGGMADFDAETLILIRGNCELISAPFSSFKPSGDGISPDFARLAFDDYGHTVVLGEYEAASDAILYEYDPGYRKKCDRIPDSGLDT